MEIGTVGIMAATVISGSKPSLLRTSYQVFSLILLITLSPEAVSGNNLYAVQPGTAISNSDSINQVTGGDNQSVGGDNQTTGGDNQTPEKNAVTSKSGRWLFLTQLGSAIIYSDNINQAPDGAAASSRIFELTPGFHFFGEGKRFKADIDYKLQYLYYSNNPLKGGGQDSKHYHHLSATTNSELIQRFLYFDANASVQQQSSSLIGLGTLDNFSFSAERANVRRYTLSPYLQHKFQNGLNAELRYSYNDLRSDNVNVVDGSKLQTISFKADSGLLANRWQWTVNALKSKINYETHLDQTHSSADLGIAYHLFPRTVVSLHGGNEIVGYQPASVGETGGNYWLIGLDWKPGKRTSVSLNAGKRYYGNSYGFSFLHTKRKSEVGIDYKEETTTSSAVQFEQQTITLGTTTDNGGVLQPAFVIIDYPVLTTNVILRKSLLGHMIWQTGKSTVTIILTRTYFNYQNTGFTENDRSGQASWKWLTTEDMTLNLTGYRRYRELLPAGTTEDLGQVEIKLMDKLTPNASAGFSISKVNRNSDNNTFDFVENRLTLSLDMKW